MRVRKRGMEGKSERRTTQKDRGRRRARKERRESLRDEGGG